MAETDTRRGSDILSVILDWSGDLPGWQRDALRRIVENGEISQADVEALVSLCRHENGF